MIGYGDERVSVPESGGIAHLPFWPHLRSPIRNVFLAPDLVAALLPRARLRRSLSPRRQPPPAGVLAVSNGGNRA